MPSKKYTASKTKSQGRSAWAVSFRHPVVKREGQTSSGIKVRRGLGTSDDNEADKLVDQLNTLLADDSYWSLGQRERAERKFNKVIVDAFYDPMKSEVHFDPWKAREEIIPLPTAEDGYTKILFLGTTGAGKTSLLRQLIGSDPEKDRFPSTSTGKTTISDTEVIIDEGTYKAVVIFFSENIVRTYIQECIEQACLSYWRNEDDERIAKEFLNHKEQRFRLSYILGAWKKLTEVENPEDWSFDEVTQESDAAVSQSSLMIDKVSSDIQIAQQSKLEEYVKTIKDIARNSITVVAQEWGSNVKLLKGDELDLVLDYFVEILEKQAGFDDLIEDVIEQILLRFENITNGELERKNSRWPERWSFESAERDEFISQVRWFSTNHAASFGLLLTPMVQGIRVKGPFYSDRLVDNNKLILMDGEGLGHAAESVADVSTRFTTRYKLADVILLIDNAEQPMQAAPLSVLRSVTTSGHQEKLAIAFTHFDQVKGLNLPGFSEKQDHVIASVKGVLNNLRGIVGDVVINSLESRIYNNCYMLGGLDKPSNKIPKGVHAQMNNMINFFRKAIEPAERVIAIPIYDPAGLSFAVQAASKEFQSLWSARLGYECLEGVSKEHRTRIKALTRRIARMGGVEYDHLQPVAELIARLSESISRFLDNPTNWEPEIISEDHKSKALDVVRKEVFESLHSLAMERLINNHLIDWSQAFEHSGRGSSYTRAKEIKGIYQTAVPIPGVELTSEASNFLNSVRKLVYDSIHQGGGKIRTDLKVVNN
ncbi:MAG: GTPase domain-containing protein [Proteobacteria bacterium]|nr:GTPase domain-containing protein [Pseudomonadota bacterium]